MSQALCENVMKFIIRFLISILLLSYSFGVCWLVTISPSGSSEALRDLSRILFFSMSALALISMWAFTWVPKTRTYAINGLFLSFAMALAFVYSGYPKSLGLIALSSPLIILSIIFIIYQCKYRKSHNKGRHAD